MKAGLAVVLALGASIAWGEAPPATITFTYSNPALEPGSYSLEIHEDGSGSYHSEPGRAASPRPPFDRAIVVGGQLRSRLFAAARKHRLFATECAMHKGNLAFTGDKTLRYAGTEGSGSCAFIYARDAQLQILADQLIALGSTLEQGRQLELLLSHDKLGLDAAIGSLAEEQASGRAAEIENLLPVLHAIAANPEVLNRTRARTTALIAIGEASR